MRQRQVQAAGRRYQESLAGQEGHCRRQQGYRQRHSQAGVKHQGQVSLLISQPSRGSGLTQCAVCGEKNLWHNRSTSARSNPTPLQAARFQPPDPDKNREYGGIQAKAHTVVDLKYNIIWCTNYRKKVLRGRTAERARDLRRQICAARGVVVLRGAVSPDRIHLLLSAAPILAPAKSAQDIKGRCVASHAG
jgi:putative transposase